MIALPPVDSVDCADTQISSILSINAASSNTKRDSASERPASPAAEVAFIWEPFEYLKDSLLSSTVVCFNHDGKYWFITRTFVTRFLATSCLVAITNTLKSWLNNIFQSENPAVKVDIPVCRDLRMMLYLCSANWSNVLSWNWYKWKGILPRTGCWIIQYFFIK